MSIKVGSIVNHSCALEWGAGKVMEVTTAMATIEFSDGKTRKIASSHFSTLEAAPAASFVPPSKPEPAAKTPARRTVKKKK